MLVGAIKLDGGAYDVLILDCMFTDVNSGTPKENELVIFPNPTDGPVNLSGSLGSDWSVRIFNSMGQALVPSGNSSDIRSINLENQPSGINFLRFSGEGKTFVKKVVKM